MHPHLERHLRRLGLSQERPPATEAAWSALLDRVSRSYDDADQDRYLLEHSVSISSEEMSALHAELTASARRYSELFNEAPAGYVVTRIVDGRHVISDCNEWALRILGAGRRALVGKPWEVAFPSLQDATLAWAFGNVPQEIHTGSGRTVDVILRGVPERDPAGQVVGARVMFLDVSGNQQLIHAEKASKAKSEFLSRVSHELRTPMNAVLGFAQLLEFDDLSDEQREHVHHIISAGRHLLGLVDGILDLSRIEAGRMDLRLEAFSILDLVRDVVGMMSPIADSGGISLRVETGPVPRAAIADVQSTRQILLNLVSNAIKYNRADGSVTIRVESLEDRAIRIRVCDTGPGMSAAQLQRLFVPFERLGAERSEVEGTGLGLAVSRLLADVMDGRLDVDSELGVGSKFTLELPAAASGVVEGAAA